MPANNPLVPVGLFGFSGHPGRRNYLEILKEDHGLLLPIEAYTAVIAAAVFRTLS
jgi:hypothetical protein